MKGLSDAASTATSCTVRTRVVGTSPASNLARLQSAKKGCIDCKSKATGVAGQGTGTVQAGDLTKHSWAGITALDFTIRSVDFPLNIDADSSIGAMLPVIDDSVAVGTLSNRLGPRSSFVAESLERWQMGYAGRCGERSASARAVALQSFTDFAGQLALIHSLDRVEYTSQHIRERRSHNVLLGTSPHSMPELGELAASVQVQTSLLGCIYAFAEASTR